jgi:hypothetical protein
MADYYSLIASAVSRLPNKTDEARRAIYERARTALQERLRALDPPVAEAELANVQSALEEAIRRVEHDVAIETAVSKMEQDLLVTDMRVREEDASHDAPSFASRLKQFIRGRRSRE